MSECQDKVVVITGASSGIGAALAEELGRRGARIVLAARRREALEAVAKRIVGAEVVPTDVTRRSEVERLRDAALARFGSSMAPANTGCGERQVGAMTASALSSSPAGMPLPWPPAHGPRVPHSGFP
jgi:NAD(P)-dependent dehydrogenase (short-subunit alcohol dehydrogenase family)